MDTRSVILKLLEGGVWHTYRLPKGSYTHDADHGWFTEWPRIREIGEGRMLMHMHGLFYDFPKTFSTANTVGLAPICSYLRMPVDYCEWNGQLVMGRDCASTTGGNKWAGQSNSALWFGQWDDLQTWGTPSGFGGVWYHDAVKAGRPSDPFLVNGFKRRVLHLALAGGAPLDVALQYDADGTGHWQTHTNLTLATDGYTWLALPGSLNALWIRLVPDADAPDVTAYFHLLNSPQRPEPSLYAGIADVNTPGAHSDGIIRARSGDARTLQFAANRYDADGALIERAFYEIDGTFKLKRVENPTADNTLRTSYGLDTADFTVDDASVVVTEGTNRFRLPKSDAAYDTAWPTGWPRGKREVVTERDLFQAHGTFYELPKPASGGFRRLRPITTHRKHITDFASWRGLFVVAGTPANLTNEGHYFKSVDGLTGLWFGNVDDLWRMGPPQGQGGPWKNTTVRAGAPSDPYLMFGYEHKELELSHDQPASVTFTVEVDIHADGSWVDYAKFTVPPDQTFKHVFPANYSAHWVRLISDTDAKATATFTYGPAVKAPVVSGINLDGDIVVIEFKAGPSDVPDDFMLVGAPEVTGPFLNIGASITATTDVFRAIVAVTNDQMFYRIRRL